jgi:hypothetical protein
MVLSPDRLRKLIECARTSLEYEIGCDDCFDKLHTFAEMRLEGKTATEAMPLVQNHLNRCEECSKEYRTLLEAVSFIHL